MATILCIDDNESILVLHKAILERKRHKVLMAVDGPGGIAIARKQHLDAVVLDFNIPGMNGDQVAKAIMESQPTVPVVICSGFIEEIPESLKWFADALVPKDNGPEALLSAIARVVKSTAQKRTPGRSNTRAEERLSA